MPSVLIIPVAPDARSIEWVVCAKTAFSDQVQWLSLENRFEGTCHHFFLCGESWHGADRNIASLSLGLEIVLSTPKQDPVRVREYVGSRCRYRKPSDMPTTVQDLSSRVDELPELLPFPAVALKLMEACKCRETGVRDLCQIIECDPSLSLKLLQIANSSLYGCGGQIRSVEHASVLLGAKGIRDLALSAAASDLFCRKPNPLIDKLWSHSLGCAAVARIIGETVPHVTGDEAFVAGLVHDVGKLVLLELLDDEYDLIPKALAASCVVKDEESYFGLSHATIGGRCGDDWGLPCEITDAICHHHSPSDADFSEALAAVVGAANQISKVWNIGVTGLDLPLEATDILEQYNLVMDQQALVHIRERAPSDFAASQKAFGA